MKTLAKITLLTAGLAAAALPIISAAETDKAATPAGARHPVLRALMQRRAVRQRIAKKLDLSTDQIAQLKAKRASTMTAVKAIRSDTSLAPEQKKAKVRETVQAARADMRSVLTPEQQSKAGKLREFLKGKLKERRKP